VEVGPVLSLLVHAALVIGLVIGLVALRAGFFDRMVVEVYFSSFYHWETMPLGDLRGHPELWSSRVGGGLCTCWVAVGLGLLVHACGAVAEAALALRIARVHAVRFEPAAEAPWGEVAFAGLRSGS
jgi:hypothetical protein